MVEGGRVEDEVMREYEVPQGGQNWVGLESVAYRPPKSSPTRWPIKGRSGDEEKHVRRGQEKL